MHKENATINTFKFLSQEIIGDILYFPVWWYSKGLAERWKIFTNHIKDAEHRLALVLWLKNMFVPMYGYYDWISRLISFVMRSVMLFIKLIGFVFWLVVYLIGFLIYLALPVGVVLMLYRSF